MEHSFSINLAKLIWIESAVLIKHILYWREHNKRTSKNFNDWKYWTYNSAKSFWELFPYMSERSILRQLKSLCDDWLLHRWNYNKNPYDKTMRYSPTEKLASLLNEIDKIDVKPSSHLIRQNGESIRQIGEPIPDINKNINKNIYKYIYIQKNIKSIYDKYINSDVNINSLVDGIVLKNTSHKSQRQNWWEMRYSVKKHIEKWLSIWRENSVSVKDRCWRIIPQPRKINDNIVKLFMVKSKKYTDDEFEYAVKVYWETVCAPWYKYKPLWFDDFLARKEWWLEKYVNKSIEKETELDTMDSFMSDFIKHDSM